ncbi:MAG: T9SS type A sorting domain-containing protein, partial [Bacteroidales bacterium]|nr:T9SS type A sorting domain-containing protein [Bacteroidales bacterium]
AGASYPASTDPPADAGEYTVTATTPADVNFKAGQVTATLKIEQAQQTITFPEPETKMLGDAPFNAGASVNTGLPLVYTSGNTDIATVSADGTITILKSGMVTITVSQTGNQNWLSASVTRTLHITSDDTTLHTFSINGQSLPVSDNMYFDAGCDNTGSFNIVITTETNAAVDKGKTFTVAADKPGLTTAEFTVTSQDGTQSKKYTLTVERRFPFGQIVQMRWDNTLTVINNPANNGGYTFTSYRWFRNGQEIASGQSWSAGKDGEKLNPSDVYYVTVTAEGITGEIRSCESNVSLRSAKLRAHPNPVSQGQTLYVEADIDDELLKDAVIEIYNIAGIRVGQMKVQGRLTPVDVRYSSGIHLFVLKGKDGFTQTLKIIVR